MATLQAMRHHIQRAFPFARQAEADDMIAEMQAEDADLERRLVKLEAFARSIDLVDAIKRLEALEKATRATVDHGLGASEQIARLAGLVEQLADRVLKLEALADQHGRALEEAYNRLQQIEAWIRQSTPGLAEALALAKRNEAAALRLEVYCRELLLGDRGGL